MKWSTSTGEIDVCTSVSVQILPILTDQDPQPFQIMVRILIYAIQEPRGKLPVWS